MDNLNEMQCMWFLTESARIYFKNQDWANVLQKCHEVSTTCVPRVSCEIFQTESRKFNRLAQNFNHKPKIQVEKHFVDIVEDQFDFHPYSMRKMTLRAYIGLLRLEDSIRGLQRFQKFILMIVMLHGVVSGH